MSNLHIKPLFLATLEVAGLIGGCYAVVHARLPDQDLRRVLSEDVEHIAEAQDRLARAALPYRYGVKSLELSLGMCSQWRVAVNHYLATNDRKPLEDLVFGKPAFSEVVKREFTAMVWNEYAGLGEQ